MDTFLVHKSGNFVNFRFKKKKKKRSSELLDNFKLGFS